MSCTPCISVFCRFVSLLPPLSSFQQHIFVHRDLNWQKFTMLSDQMANEMRFIDCRISRVRKRQQDLVACHLSAAKYISIEWLDAVAWLLSGPAAIMWAHYSWLTHTSVCCYDALMICVWIHNIVKLRLHRLYFYCFSVIQWIFTIHSNPHTDTVVWMHPKNMLFGDCRFN